MQCCFWLTPTWKIYILIGLIYVSGYTQTKCALITRQHAITAFRECRAAYNKWRKKLFGYARCDSMSGILIESSVFQLPTLLCITLMFCLLVIACCHEVRSFSGLQTLLCGNFIFCVFSPFQYVLACSLAFILWTAVWNKRGWWWWWLKILTCALTRLQK